MATIALWQDKNLYANSEPLPDENDSTFIIKICKSVPGLNNVFRISFCFLDLSEVFQSTTFFDI